MRIDRFTIGVRLASKMFRIQSVGGVVVDNILALRGKDTLSEDYFTEVVVGVERSQYALKNEKLGNNLTVDTEGIVFSKDNYENKKECNMVELLADFRIIWETVNSSLRVDDIRRIGLAAEHQLSVSDNPTAKNMIETFTKFKPPTHSGRFMLHYEDRRPTKESIAPDIEKSDFLNCSFDLYDGELDAHHSKKNTLNANIDVQRYFSPLLKKNCVDEFSKLMTTFNSEKLAFEKRLKDLGVLA